MAGFELFRNMKNGRCNQGSSIVKSPFNANRSAKNVRSDIFGEFFTPFQTTQFRLWGPRRYVLQKYRHACAASLTPQGRIIL